MTTGIVEIVEFEHGRATPGALDEVVEYERTPFVAGLEWGGSGKS